MFVCVYIYIMCVHYSHVKNKGHLLNSVVLCVSGPSVRSSQPQMNNNTWRITLSLFTEQKLGQNGKAMCDKLSTPLLLI